MEDKLLSKDYSQLQDNIKELDDILNSLIGENCKLQQQLLISEKAGV